MHLRTDISRCLSCLSAWVGLGLGAVAWAAEHPLVIINRDRSASFPDAQVPYQFDGTTGSNILWKTRLPNWSNSSPILSNGRLFLTVEPWQPRGYSPYLFCLDAASGRELWRRELDAVAAFPPIEQEALRGFAAETWVQRRLCEKIWSESLAVWRARKQEFAAFDQPPADLQERWAQWRTQIEALGYAWSQHRGGPGAEFVAAFPPAAAKQRLDRLRSLGLGWEMTWRGYGTWLGVGYPSPCADGQRVWTVTLQNLWSCHDRDGRLLWQVRFAPTSGQELTEDQLKRVGGRRNWHAHYPGAGGYSTSPQLVDLDGNRQNLVVLGEFNQMVRCLDANTGQERWKQPMPYANDQATVHPAVVLVDREPVLITMGCQGVPRGQPWPGYEMFRIRDGKSVGYLPGLVLAKGASHGAIVLEDGTVVMWSDAAKERELVARRLRWNADRTAIEVQEHWRAPVPVRHLDPFQRYAWCDNVLYADRGFIDLREGKLLPVKPAVTPSFGYCGYNSFVAGPAMGMANWYGGKWVRFSPKDESCAEFVFCDRQSGKFLGVGRLPVNPPDGASPAQKLQETFTADQWRWLGAASPWAAGSRLYVRSFDFLWCIGPTSSPAEPVDPTRP